MTQEKPALKINVSTNVAVSSKAQVTVEGGLTSQPVTANTSKYQMEPLPKMIFHSKQPQQQQEKEPQKSQPRQKPPAQSTQQQHLQQGPPNSSVITHTKNCTNVSIAHPIRKPGT